MKIFSSSLATKLFIANAIIIISALTFAGLNGYFQSESAIDKAVTSHVFGVLGERQARINAWRVELQRDLTVFNAFEQLSSSEINLLITSHLRSNNSLNFCAVLDKDGLIITSAGNYSGQKEIASLAVVKNALNGNFTVGTIHLDSENKSILNVASPLGGESSESVMIYLCQINVSQSLDPILADTVGLGYSGESFLVGSDTVMLTPSRFHNHPDPLTHKMPIPTVLEALEGNSGVKVYRNFLGQQVVGAYTFMEDFDWVLITEMVTDEAFEPLQIIARNTIIAALIGLILLLIFALLISQTWTKPIESLADASLKVADQDFSVQVREDERLDEIGTLTRQFNRMVLAIRESRDKLKLSHTRLVQAQKMAAIGELASSIVHEMRNPLSAIKMNLRFLQLKPENNKENDPLACEQIEIASEEAGRLEKMLSELLDYSKPLKLNLKTISSQDLIKRSIELVKNDLNENRIEISDGGNSVLWADEDLITRVTSNLLMNSIQSSQPDSKIILDISEVDKGIQIKVIDSGIGMSSNIIERLFEPFFTTREDGIGLGMPNVKKIIEAHSGSIEIDSKENHGTTVRVIIPKEN